MGWKPIAHDKPFVAHCSLIYIYTPSAWIHFIPFIFAWVLIESEYLEVANVVSAHLLTIEIAQNIAKMTYISSTMACSLEKVTTSQGIVSIYFFRFSSKKRMKQLNELSSKKRWKYSEPPNTCAIRFLCCRTEFENLWLDIIRNKRSRKPSKYRIKKGFHWILYIFLRCGCVFDPISHSQVR